jgi:hypothetical protein
MKYILHILMYSVRKMNTTLILRLFLVTDQVHYHNIIFINSTEDTLWIVTHLNCISFPSCLSMAVKNVESCYLHFLLYNLSFNLVYSVWVHLVVSG